MLCKSQHDPNATIVKASYGNVNLTFNNVNFFDGRTGVQYIFWDMLLHGCVIPDIQVLDVRGDVRRGARGGALGCALIVTIMMDGYKITLRLCQQSASARGVRKNSQAMTIRHLFDDVDDMYTGNRPLSETLKTTVRQYKKEKRWRHTDAMPRVQARVLPHFGCTRVL